MASLRTTMAATMALLAMLLVSASAKFTFSGLSKELIAAKRKLAYATTTAVAISSSAYNPCLLLRSHGSLSRLDSVLGHPCSSTRASAFSSQTTTRQERLLRAGKGGHQTGGHHPPGVGHHPPGSGHQGLNGYGIQAGHHPAGVGHHPTKGHHCNKPAFKNVCSFLNTQDPTARYFCCRKGCINLNKNKNHCGGCGRFCTQLQSCCFGVCIDINTDPNNCGGCVKAGLGTTCPAGETCVLGVCSGYGSTKKV